MRGPTTRVTKIRKDNITAPMIGPEQFDRWCAPLYEELAGMLAEDGRLAFVHMDGDLRALWGRIATSPIRGIDSLSPPPDNDTSVADCVREWPEMRVWVNYPSSVFLAPPEAIYAQTVRLLEEGAHTGRLQIQISENPPPGAWRMAFPEIVRAVREFGCA